MENYDYKIEQIKFKSDDHVGEVAKFLHQMSEQGWRLASLDIKNQLQQNIETLKVVLMHKKEEGTLAC
jgi:hypothetical protein